MTRSIKDDSDIFRSLMKGVYLKCFGHPLTRVPTESDCMHWSYEIEENTGLIIGWRSLKNYALSVLSDAGKQVHPSPSTLDTLSRYLLGAPFLTEVQRKSTGDSYAYWFQYRERHMVREKRSGSRLKISWKNVLPFIFILATGIVATIILLPGKHPEIEEDFQRVDEKSLVAHGWNVLSRQEYYWEKRGEFQNRLTLFTLKGDSWRTKDQAPEIQNMLYRKSPKDYFSAEVHFSDFIPGENWQQSGLILMEDTLFQGKNIRISLAYNDYFGGVPLPGEIYIQVVAYNGKINSNIEEVIHYPIYKLDGALGKDVVISNLKYSALKVEKQAKVYRFLYAASPFDNFPFKEMGSYEIEMEPKYVGIFAIKGFIDSTSVMPVSIRLFKLESLAGK